MKERPIIFSGEMVRAILDGRKTQTRRVVTYMPGVGESEEWCGMAESHEADFVRIVGDYRNLCPYGTVGERLWVRETWCPSPDGPIYRATEYEHGILEADDEMVWKPSIHMPRWASRLSLEIVNVRVERLREIGEGEAQADGAEISFESPTGQIVSTPSYLNGFIKLWNAINFPRGFGWWENPWVWVIEFKRVENK